MNLETIYLRSNNNNVKLDAYIATESPEITPPKRPCMIVLPGGGYRFLSWREAEPIAKAYMGYGYNAFVLYYSINDEAVFPNPLIDISLAIKHVRENADKYNVDPDKIYVCGFSAGGHLAASIATMWNSDLVYKNVEMPYGINKPNGAILSYPVISAHEFAHKDSFYAILGKETDDFEELDKYSLEKRVAKDTVPCFVWHTVTDDGVPVENSLLFSLALSKNKIPFEVHLFPEGPHGLSLATEEVSYYRDALVNERVQEWVRLSVLWMKDL